MKRLLVFLFIIPIIGFAQQTDVGTSTGGSGMLSKKGFPILPQAGDFGIGFDAVPFLEYAGNIFNGSNSNSVEANFQNSTQQLVGKYFLDESTAIRARVRFRLASDVDRNRVILDNQAAPDPNVQVVDERKFNTNFIQIGAGLEKRRGQGRLYGIYGGEVSFFSEKDKTTYDYGNPMSLNNQTPTTTTNFGNGNSGAVTNREVEELSGRTLSFGLNGFAGVEYFFAPKMGISAEFTYGFELSRTLRGRVTEEFWDVNTESVREDESVTEGGSNFTLDTGNFGGAINLFFYF
ncbi:hypothetical protein FNH22_21440 [Fulvivirga sp. M361]|uniref:hypothetical protein n=1 Tax=Fulvivirga sp. M361 TaxID=2594266 RepID=UPI00117BA994|nr:hypothetical protein [Fulvivirga sp. M361]TRX53075.1 hypothetical protein FNH22_21440 [Fulvivirga sp. M361]